jgi:hypothetical protein
MKEEKTQIADGVASELNAELGCDIARNDKRWLITNNIVRDTETNLEWLLNFEGSEMPVSLNEALKMGKTFGKGWRLPTVRELQSIMLKKGGKEGIYINTDVFLDVSPKNFNYKVWSDEPMCIGHHWLVAHFGMGFISSFYKDSRYYVRLVRSRW